MTDPWYDPYWESSENMEDVDDGSIQSVITSPPYYDLKDYGHKNEIGSADSSYERYQSRLKTVWSECYDKLKEDGSMWVVVDTVMVDGDTKLIPHHIKNHAEEVGFHFQDMVVWYKPTSLGGLNPKNLVNKKEYIVYLSKTEAPKFLPEQDSRSGEEDPAISSDGRLGDLWRFPIKRGSLGRNVLHKAPFPIDLVKRIVEISTEKGDVVLDPFFGSGTTAYAALDLDRNCVGYEINEEFKTVLHERMSEFSGYEDTLQKWTD